MSLSKENKVVIDGVTYYGGLNQPNLKFVKVYADCWEKIFDYLPLRDILAMSQTCQRMEKIGGRYFRENFHGTEFRLPIDVDPTLTFDVNNPSCVGRSTNVKRVDFLRFADTLCLKFWCEENDHIGCLQRYTSRNVLQSIETLILYEAELSENIFHGLSSVTNNIETLEITRCAIKDHSLGQFLASCSKLKCFRLYDVKFESNTSENSVFQRVYPTLTDFEWTDCKEPVSLLSLFLKRNSSIKNLRIGMEGLWGIRFEWTSKIELNQLVIDIDALKGIPGAECAKRMKALHAKGHFKTLRLYDRCFDSDWETFYNEMASFAAFEVLYIDRFNANIRHLSHLNELHFKWPNFDIDFEAITKNLIHLERLWISCTVDQFLLFLRYSKALAMAILKDRTGHGNALNLRDFSEAREMGGSKRKVKIGVDEDVYLATKWKTENVDYDLVEITRMETIREHFAFTDYH